MKPALPAVAFGPFVLDAAEARLLRGAEEVLIEPVPLALLGVLVARAGQLVARDDLLQQVWGERPVGDAVLKVAVNALRRALGDDARQPRWVETVPRRGYRFIAPVHRLAQAPRPVSPPAAPPPGNLPAGRGALIGRDAEVSEVVDRLSRHRLVTLVGAGGIGKTRLALETASHCQPLAPQGVWLLRLDALADAAPLVGSLAHTLGLSPAAARDADALARALSARQLLLVLDNCEHLADGVAALVTRLLDGVPGLRVLATSQHALRLAGEVQVRLGPLGWPDAEALDAAERCPAVMLFGARVRALQPSFAIDDGNRRQVSEICAALDGLPLALELAAARVPLLGVAGVHARLGGRLELLAMGARDAAHRHRTLRAAVAWSTALLGEAEPVVLRRLAVFAGSFSAGDAAAVVADAALDTATALAALGELVDKSLVAAEAAGGSARLRLYGHLREYAAEQLAAAGEAERFGERHARHVERGLRQAFGARHGLARTPWAEALLAEIDNLRQAQGWAMRHGPRELAASLTVHALPVLVHAGLHHEALRWAEAWRPDDEALADAALRAAWAQGLALLCVAARLVDAQRAVACAQEALRLHQGPGSAREAYYDLYLLWHALLRAEPDTPRDAIRERMRALEQPSWTARERVWRRRVDAFGLRARGDAEGWCRAAAEELELARASGSAVEVWEASHHLAMAECDAGRPAQALALFEAVLRDIRAAGALHRRSLTVSLHAAMRLVHGDIGAHAGEIREALQVLRAEGQCWLLADGLAWGALRCGRKADAARLLGWADATLERLGEHRGQLFGRWRQGCLQRLQRELLAAELPALMREGGLLGEEEAIALFERALAGAR